MQTPIIQQIRSLTDQLDIINRKLGNTKDENKIKSLLKRNDILIRKRVELAKRIGLMSWEEIYDAG
jgi:hypothetical protein